MKNLQKTCMSRPESWWTYEVCFRPANELQEQKKIVTDNNINEDTQSTPLPLHFTSGARQFRANTILVQDGKTIKQTQVRVKSIINLTTIKSFISRLKLNSFLVHHL